MVVSVRACVCGMLLGPPINVHTHTASGRRNEALRIYKLKASVLPTFPPFTSDA